MRQFKRLWQGAERGEGRFCTLAQHKPDTWPQKRIIVALIRIAIVRTKHAGMPYCCAAIPKYGMAGAHKGEMRRVRLACRLT